VLYHHNIIKCQVRAAQWYEEGMRSFAEMLAGGDRRSIGRADEAVALVAAKPERFEELWACLPHRDGLVRMRAGDALEKLSRAEAAPFQAHKQELLGGGLDDGTAELRWHLIAIAARLTLSEREAGKFCVYLEERLHHDPSRIVRVSALQAGFDLASRHRSLAAAFRRMLGYASGCDVPALRARARKLAAKAASL
jgi:hypothetical protein